MASLDNIKIVLEISDDLQDDLLTVIRGYAVEGLKMRLKYFGWIGEEIPNNLQWIIDELVIARYNRIGSEGYKSENVADRNITFESDEYERYNSSIKAYVDSLKDEIGTGSGNTVNLGWY